ncbi:MAG: ArsR/SmtB family transcription factor [Dermatophilaceae bacterium]
MAAPKLAASCTGTLESPLPRAKADELSGLLKAVADPVRLQLLSIIRAAVPQTACVCDLTNAVNLSQPTVSHHLKVLTEAGLLTRQRRGSWAWYTLVPTRLEDIAAIFGT